MQANNKEFGGMVIGNQMDEEALRKKKLLAQKSYQQQLEDDKFLKPIEFATITSSRRRSSFDNNNNYVADESSFLHIGSFDAYQKENQRRIAMEISQMNREEAKLKSSRRNEGTSRDRDREAEQRVFEESPVVFAIGYDDKDNKEHKRRQALEVLAQNREDGCF